MSNEDYLEQELERRIASIRHQHHEEIVARDEAISELTNNLISLNQVVQRLETLPFFFGTVIYVNNTPDVYRFQHKDKVAIVDEEIELYGQGGTIVSHDPVVNEDGCVTVELTNGITRVFSIGTESPAQIRLTEKSDGTKVIINVDGKPCEVLGAPELDIQIGHVVKIHSETKQIVSLGESFLMTGPIVTVDAVLEDCIEISDKGERKTVLNTLGIPLEEGDRIVVDSGHYVVLRKLPQDSRNKYKLCNETVVEWDQIGGLEEAKAQCQEAIELPYKYPEKFKFYNVKPQRGLLFYGPPGCGKTLMARAIATALMRTHKKEDDEQVLDSGYIYVKSPEILDKWVGNSEAEIRRLFERGRVHFRKHGYKAVLVFDEFDAIAPQRGSRRSSDVADTIVPMFLGEMDGVDEVQTRENPIVVVMTNRPDVLDPAITRPGRITKHIKVNRPNPQTARQILEIHTKDMPFQEENKEVFYAVICQDIFSKSRLLYRINNEHDFTFGDCISGAMIEAICERAKMNALHRDILNNTETGVSMEDFRKAITNTYEDQVGLNHSYDLQDFAEKIGIQPSKMVVERSFCN